jgi:hypothetical protein
MDADVVEFARQAPHEFARRGVASELILSTQAFVAAIDGDVDAAIVAGEAALQMATDGQRRADLMLVLAECYAARGRAADARAMLTRARKADPRSPRLPHVSRIVAEHLAQGAVALSP